jgi:hypothetical protein
MPYHSLLHLHKPNHLLDHEQHSYQSHHPPAFEETADPGQKLSSTSHATFAQYLQPYAKSWTVRTLRLPYSQQTTTANPPTLTLCAPMPSTLFASEYYTGETEEIQTAEALRAPDREQFIIAIKKEVQSLISDTKTSQPLTRTATGYAENVDQKRVWKIRTTLKCKRKKKSNGEPDKHKARAAARGTHFAAS